MEPLRSPGRERASSSLGNPPGARSATLLELSLNAGPFAKVKTRCLIFYFILISIFNYGAFHTSYSRWQIPTVYDFKDRHDIQLLQTETPAFEVCRQFLAIRRPRAGAQDRTHSSDRHARTRNQSPAKRAAILRRRTS